MQLRNEKHWSYQLAVAIQINMQALFIHFY